MAPSKQKRKAFGTAAGGEGQSQCLPSLAGWRAAEAERVALGWHEEPREPFSLHPLGQQWGHLNQALNETSLLCISQEKGGWDARAGNGHGTRINEEVLEGAVEMSTPGREIVIAKGAQGFCLQQSQRMHFCEVSWAFCELFIDGIPTAMKKKKKLTPFKKTSNGE